MSLIFAFLFSIQLMSQDFKSNGPITAISFEDTEFNFGEIYEGESIQNVYTFTNTGNKPLILSSVKGSCGCTVPEWPKQAILPGESSYLLVQFNSKNKKGLQTKRITITANTDPVQSFLTLKGEILKDEESATLKLNEKNRSFEFSGDLSATNINLYPNPTSDFLKIDLSAYKGKSASIDVYNSLGEKLKSKNVTEITSNEMQIELQDYKSGTYVASIKIENMNRLAKQFVVVKN